MTEYGITQESLVVSAAQALRKMLLSGEPAMGEPVREEALAGRLGISRPPVREAMRLVHGEGLLEQIPRRGYRVATFSDQEVREIIDLRELLESKALQLIADRLEPPELGALEAVVERMRESSEIDDAPQVISLATDFHLEVVRLAGNSRLTSYSRELMLQMQLWLANNAGNSRNEASSSTLYEQHRELLDVLALGDWPRILQAFGDHSSYDSLQRSAVNPAAIIQRV